MIVRRLPTWLLVALVSAAAPEVASASGCVTAGRARQAVENLLARLLVPVASAQQEVLEFKPVPPESAARMEQARPSRRRAGGTRQVPPVEQVPATPGTPLPPAPPEPPGTPITIGKSGNIMRVGSDIHIESDQVVVGDVMALGGDVTVDGHVEGDVVAMGGDVYVHAGGRVDGDVVCMGGELHEDEGAVIGGQRVTASRHGRHPRIRHERDLDGARPGIAGPVVWLLITLGLAWAFASLAPGRTGRSLQVLKQEPGASAVTGILAAMLTVPSIVALCLLVALLCITIIGIPLAIGALFGYFAFLGVLWVWGYVIGASAIGDWIARRAAARRSGAAASLAMGSAAVSAGGPVAAAPPAAASLTTVAVYGVLVIGGAGLLGAMFKMVGIGAIGTLLTVFSWLAFSGITLIGAGAWLRAEFKAGTLSRIWGGRRRAAAANAIPESGPAGVATPAGEPPVTPAG